MITTTFFTIFLMLLLITRTTLVKNLVKTPAMMVGLFSVTIPTITVITIEAQASSLSTQAEKYFQDFSPKEQITYTFPLLTTGKKTSGSIKTQNVTLFRWQRTPEIVFGQDQVSFLLNSKGELAGFARMIPTAATAPLPSKEESEKIAKIFLQNYAPDLLPVMNIQWIHPHTDEKYTDGKNQYHINGMKVKCRNNVDGTYFWVIVGSDSSVIVFERDIEWDFIRAGRQTEKWLHDEWLKKEKILFTRN